MAWLPMDSGQTIGTPGSEEGIIVLDDEHTSGARITLENGGHTAPWSVTCGIYGGFMHTAFASSEVEGRAKVSDMKADLEKIMVEENDEARFTMMRRFATLY